MLEDILSQGFAELDLACDGEMLRRYRIYYEELEETNKVMNLTAISGEADVARLHFLDCAALLTLTDFAGKSVIDIGTGAGFPGLALKIACPDMRLTLLDSLDKRIGFLKSTCEKLGFEDVECLHARAEEAKELRGGYDIVCSRAVARLNVLCELCLPFVKEGGVFIAMKGPDCKEELNEAGRCISILGGKIEKLADLHIPGLDASHNAVIIRKVRPSPDKYPRRWAQIKKAPL